MLAPDSTASFTTLLEAHTEALRLLCGCLYPAVNAAQDHAAQLARSGSGGSAGRPAPLARRLESFSHAAQSVLMSHLLRLHARLAEQAAAAASAAVADTCCSGDSAGTSSGSSSHSASRAAAAEYQAAVLAKLLSALTATLADIAHFSQVLLVLQPTAAVPVPQPPPAAASRGGGGAGGKGKGTGGGGGAGAVVVMGGVSSAADRARPLAELLVLELARSGFLDQAARLVLHSATADGAARRQQQQRELTGLTAGCGSSNNGVPEPLPLPGSEMTLRLVGALCDLTRPIGTTWGAAELARCDGSSSGNDSTSSSGSSSSCGLPLPWGTCLQTLALAQVVVTLEAAGFGGGERGVWGLPAELAAGLPLLAHSYSGSPAGLDLRVTHHHKPSAGGRVKPPTLCADPFSLLNHVARSLNLMAVAMPTAAGAPPGRAPTSAGACGAASAGADTGAGGRGADGDCWSFPISPQAMALVLLRVADLAAASLDQPATVAVAAAGEAAAAPVGLQAPASLLRLHPADAFSEGLDAVLNARSLLVRRRTSHRPQQLMPTAAPVPRGNSAAAGGGGDRGGGGIQATESSAAYGDEYGDVYPRLPVVWWRTLARMLPHAMAPPPQPATSSTSSSGGTASMSPGEAAGRLIQWAKMVLAADMPPPDALLQRAPPALAAALAGGLVPGVEAAVRAASGPHLAIGFAAAFLKVDVEADAHLGDSWPLLQQLLAFAPPTQMAALIASLGKQGHLAVDGIAAAVDGSAVLGWMKTVTSALPSFYLFSKVATATGAATGAASGTGGDGTWGAHDAPRPPHVRRLQLHLSHALHRWLPVLSRIARLLLLADHPAGPALPLASPHVVVLHWCAPMLWSLASKEALVAACSSVDLTTSCAAANLNQAAAAAMAARAAAAAAAAASWRQVLFHDIELVPLLESALRMLAALPAGDRSAAVAHLVAQVLALLPQTAPDVLAPVLRPPLPPDSPWHPAAVAAALQKHMPGGSAEEVPADTVALDQLRAAAAVATPAELRAGYMGGPVARLAKVPRVMAGDILLCGLSSLDVTTAAELEALEVVEAALSSSSAAASKWTLRCCANPSCTNLAGRSEAELPLQACAGCGAVRYCGRACQTAHWRAGHKEACSALKGRGGAGAAAAG
ncbi:hypothetical protein HXX76_008422 [Chlamydomonas incerta]|uniref:phytol kinase n=1 Tax=Chlamydomonas incerta TaxID=51695 RepID=A0A835VZ83_CHLIN|nr:hypothetical protein HXX76_008422 [Chlamydomonas incerta]|eukprot:KAG2433360.1 hypothetical protein HXX76_008422 [Chlamydomonas incerta]